MRAIAVPTCTSRSAPSHPVWAAGSVSIHVRIAWITTMSHRRLTTASPPGRVCCVSSAMRSRVARIQSALVERDASTWITGGSAATSCVAAGCSKRIPPQTM